MDLIPFIASSLQAERRSGGKVVDRRIPVCYPVSDILYLIT
jgi:hypothetical protein